MPAIKGRLLGSVIMDWKIIRFFQVHSFFYGGTLFVDRGVPHLWTEVFVSSCTGEVGKLPLL